MGSILSSDLDGSTSGYYYRHSSDSKDSIQKTRICLISTPHAKCKHVSGHTCDSISEKGSQFLKTELISNGWMVSLQSGDINRSEIDLNRYESRFKTEFRENIWHIYMKYVGKPLWVWDVHSYPDGKYSDTPSECVLLSPYGNTRARKHNHHLKAWLSQEGISVILYEGSQINDITTEATGFGYEYVFLLELNEFLSDSRMRFLMNRIVFWMNSH